MSAFDELGLCPELIAAINNHGWNLPTNIQAESIPLVLGGGDVCAAAETGSGKTASFVLPAVQLVSEFMRSKSEAKISTVEATKFTNSTPLSGLVLVNEDVVGIKKVNPIAWKGIQANEGGGTDISWMYEVELVELEDSILRLGFSQSGGSTNELGTDMLSYGYGGTGKKVFKGLRGTYVQYGETYGQGDVIGCYVSKDGPTIGFTKNGIDLGPAIDLNTFPPKSLLRPAICGKGKFHIKVRYRNFLFPMPGFAGVPDTKIYSQPTSKDGTQCLIIAPTRDLVQQTYEYTKNVAAYMIPPITVGNATTGTTGAIVVGTIQSIMGAINRNKLNLNLILLILDEADDLTKDNRIIDIHKLQQSANAHPQTLFFSATLHGKEVLDAIDKFCIRPTFIDLKGRPSIPDTVYARIVLVEPSKHKIALPDPPTDGIHIIDRDIKSDSHCIKLLKPKMAVHLADKLKMDSCLVFCRTNVDCNNFEKYLNALGGGKQANLEIDSGKQSAYTCVVLAGQRAPAAREKALSLFKEGRARFLICTDVAARGLDINRLPYLIIMCLPDDPDQYIHRVGRVGREGRNGLAISLVSPIKEKVWYHKCGDKTGACKNTRLLENKGCTILYDELSCLNKIETLIGAKLEVRTQDELIKEINIENQESNNESPQGRRTEVSANVIFGSKKEESNIDSNLYNHAAIAKKVQNLDQSVERNFLHSWIMTKNC